MTLTFGSLFSGIGGIDLGLQRAGFQIAWQVEIDEYASQVLAKHWPDVARFRDIRDCGRHNLSHVDLIAGGFPCQPHSLAGKRRASADDRDLWDEFYRIICELRPRWVVAENVPGLLSSEDGRFFGRVLRDLAQGGYDAEWQVLSATSVGAPHLRERIFLVAYTSQYRCDTRRTEFERQERAVSLGRGGTSPSSLPNTNGNRQWLRQDQPQRERECNGTPNTCDDGSEEYVADSNGAGCPELDTSTIANSQRYSSWRNLAPGTVSDAPSRRERLHIFSRGTQGPQPVIEQSSWWAVESPFCGVANGIPRRVDRLRGLGNAVVPQVAEYVGRCILASVQAECEVSA